MFLYAVWLCAFLVLTYSIQSVRYVRALKDLDEYREMLTKLENEYAKEDRRKQN